MSNAQAKVVDLAEYRARRAREAEGRTNRPVLPYAVAASMPTGWPMGYAWAPCLVWLGPWFGM
jgi:hypothetical protein